MADEIASLRIDIRSLEAKVAQQRLDGLTRSGIKAEASTNKLTSSFVKFAGPAAIATGAIAGLSQIVSVTREFDILNAQLITATGSSANAAIAFEAIQRFAATTPYDLAQATEGFTKLVNLGLNPSERALRSYGDTSSALGKDLIQLVEAVADAQTGQFERLKEFNIGASKQGDSIAFTFRGVTKTVKNNAQEIQEYLIGIGETNFAGAMTERMKTLDGAISNFGDSWNSAVLNVSQMGIGGVIEDSFRLATSSVDEFNAQLTSGELEAYMGAIAGQFDGWATAAADAFDFITGAWSEVPSEWEMYAKTGIDAFLNALKFFPIEVETLVKLAATELAVFVDYAGIYGEYAVDAMFAYFGAGVERAKVYGKAIAEALDFTSDYDLEAELAKVNANFEAYSASALDAATARADISAQVRREVITDIMDERRAAIESFDTQIKKGESLRSKWDEIQEAKASSGIDVLEQFGLGAPADSDKPSDSETKANAKAEKIAADKEARERAREDRKKERLAEAAADAFNSLVESLQTEEEAIQSSYDARLAIILDNTEEGSNAQHELKKRLDEDFSNSVLEGFEATYEDQVSYEMDLINDAFERKRQLILENTEITEQQRTELELQLTNSRNDQIAALEQTRIQMTLQSSSSLFSSLASLTASAGAEQSALYQTLFAASKAFAIADASISIQQSIAKAMKLGFPENVPLIAEAVSTGAGIISTLQSTDLNFAGMYDKGGDIPSGSFGIVGEYGPEFVKGPVSVTGREKTADILKNASASSSSAGMTVQQNITVNGNGDKALISAMQQAAAKGTTDAYALIERDFKTNRGVSQYAARR
jgi:hypothetical protein